MAKLSARGRTEVYRIMGTVEGRVTGKKYTQIMALLSDREILMKWKEGTGKWRKYSKLKPESTPEQWLANKLAKGWTKI